MKPKNKSGEDQKVPEKESLAQIFPGLAIPNEPQKPLTNETTDVNDEKLNDSVADIMAQFEAHAPSSKEKEKREPRKERSQSPRPKKMKKNTKSPNRRRRSRSRSYQRDSKRNRSRSRERRSRRERESHDGHNRSRHRQRSRERSRSRSRDRRKDQYNKRYNHDRNSPELEEDPVTGKVLISKWCYLILNVS